MKRLIYLSLAALMVLAVSCKKDKATAPKVPESAVDLGIVMTREDGTTYKLYWAKSNLSESGLCANSEDYGDYYAWGETEPYYEAGHSLDNPCDSWRTRTDCPITGYNWDSYKFRISGDNYDNVKFSKYNTKESFGPVDNITELQRGEKEGETIDDAARAKLGGRWRMPTEAEWNALRSQCARVSATQNGIDGLLLTAPNGNSIFLPLAGYRTSNSFLVATTNGFYWSSSFNLNEPHSAYGVNCRGGTIGGGYYVRYCGFSIRPVWEE